MWHLLNVLFFGNLSAVIWSVFFNICFRPYAPLIHWNELKARSQTLRMIRQPNAERLGLKIGGFIQTLTMLRFFHSRTTAFCAAQSPRRCDWRSNGQRVGPRIKNSHSRNRFPYPKVMLNFIAEFSMTLGEGVRFREWLFLTRGPTCCPSDWRSIFSFSPYLSLG